MQTQQTKKSIMWRTWDWLDGRYDLTTLMGALLHVEIPRSVRTYYLGGITLFFFIVQAITGMGHYYGHHLFTAGDHRLTCSLLGYSRAFRMFLIASFACWATLSRCSARLRASSITRSARWASLSSERSTPSSAARWGAQGAAVARDRPEAGGCPMARLAV